MMVIISAWTLGIICGLLGFTIGCLYISLFRNYKPPKDDYNSWREISSDSYLLHCGRIMHVTEWAEEYK